MLDSSNNIGNEEQKRRRLTGAGILFGIRTDEYQWDGGVGGQVLRRPSSPRLSMREEEEAPTERIRRRVFANVTLQNDSQLSQLL